MVSGSISNLKEIKKWKKQDTDAKVILMSTITPKEQQAFVNCKTAFAIWTKLAAQYLQNASANTHVLQARFFHYQYVKGNNMMSHITAVEGLAQQLEDLGSPMTQSQIMTKIVSTLPIEFRHFTTVWDNLPETEKTIPQLITKLMNEQHRNNSSNTSSTPVVQPAEAFAARSGRPVSKPYRPSENADRKRKREECEYCGKFNHSESTCTRRINAEAGHPDIQCEYCRNYDHSAIDCNKRKRDERNKSKKSKTSPRAKLAKSASLDKSSDDDEDENGVALGASSASMDKEIWYADSGATHHMCDDHSCMINYSTFSSHRTVKGIGGVKLTVRGKGDIRTVMDVKDTRHNATLHDVLHVPGLGTNLLSIASVTERGIDVAFTKQMVSFTKNGLFIMTGNRSDKELYRLNMRTVPVIRNETIAHTATVDRLSLSVWHQRLSHVNYKTIVKMVSGNMVHGIKLDDYSIPTEVCSGCALGKMHRLPFKKGRERAKQIGELVHADVCGPMQQPSPSGSRYYVTFKDDFSGYRAIYFLKLKSDVFDCFKLFVCKLKSETNHNIRTLRSDGGGEFLSTEFVNWLTEKCIRHETTVAHTPQQNGVIERDHRTTGEAERSSILNMKNIPQELWAESYNCAVYTLNRTLSSTISATPYELWFGRKPKLDHHESSDAKPICIFQPAIDVN